ncbi:SWIM zinc finger family protein, partial [Acidovorax kalamii]
MIQFTNAGLVKRALRELAGGYRPALALDDAATLSARFDDGIEVQWPQGLSIAQSRCNCGANGVCRHRLIAVLAYREQVPADAAPATPALDAVSDAELAATLSPAVLQEAERARAAGLRVELRGRADGEPCDTARLPSATVRYWAGGALAAARCDCLRGSACAHVALGLWAFRAAQGARSVQLGAPATARALDRLPFLAAVDTLLRLGVTHGSGALGQALSQARAASREAAWLALLVAELESWAEAYARRSARYDAADGVDLLAELALRLAAGGQPGQAAAVLGLGQSGETLLDRLRLMTLGARTRRDGAQRQTELVLADLDTGTRLVLRHDWTPPEGSDAAAEAQQRARERLAPG